jgi:hypothetical protein
MASVSITIMMLQTTIIHVRIIVLNQGIKNDKWRVEKKHLDKKESGKMYEKLLEKAYHKENE